MKVQFFGLSDGRAKDDQECVGGGLIVVIDREILFELPNGADDAVAMVLVADRLRGERRPRGVLGAAIAALREIHD